jgi:hypothetical protein
MKRALKWSTPFVIGLVGLVLWSGNVNDANQIFKLVFDGLPAEATVYPTENYYYFELPVGGRIIHGNLRLDVHDRDQGLIHFGYFELRDGEPVILGARVFGPEDGVEVKKIDDWHYEVSAFGKTVNFTLNDAGFEPPPEANMAPGEVYVGPVFDESGVRFHLMFQATPPHFFYVLQKPGPPDSVTGFVFFDDSARNRKILIGVKNENIQKNNYYDGPFDQLPDNYASKTNLKKYIELAYPDLRGQIDDYGAFINKPGSRLAISPYYSYDDLSEFEFVRKCKNSFKAWPEFLTCITPDFYQLNSPRQP